MVPKGNAKRSRTAVTTAVCYNSLRQRSLVCSCQTARGANRVCMEPAVANSEAIMHHSRQHDKEPVAYGARSSQQQQHQASREQPTKSMQHSLKHHLLAVVSRSKQHTTTNRGLPSLSRRPAALRPHPCRPPILHNVIVFVTPSTPPPTHSLPPPRPS